MNETLTPDQADACLRRLVADADPEAGREVPVPADLLDRVRADMADPVTDAASAPAAAIPEPVATRPATARPGFVRRHWQGGLLVAAGVCSLALAAGSMVPGLVTGVAGSDDAGGAAQSAPAASDAGGREILGDAANAPDQAAGAGSGTEDASDGAKVEQRLVRSGSVLVGTDDQDGARDRFVVAILAMGGRVMSESVVTEGVDGYPGYDTSVTRDMAGVASYPWYPTGPGIWLVVQVPAASYDKAIQAARASGEVVQMQQSSYDVGTQIADTDARIAALEASLARLTALMDRAEDVSDVIALEQAIASRQAELDALKAQQRDLATQTAMSQVSLTLMDPDDARQSVDPTPEQTWWESFLDGLGQAWTWLGQALLVLSPLLLAGAVIAAVRRRGRRAAAATTPAGQSPGATAASQPGSGPDVGAAPDQA